MEENERQIIVLKIVLGTLAWALEKTPNLPPFRSVCMSFNVTRALRYYPYNLGFLLVYCIAKFRTKRCHGSFVVSQVKL